MACSERTQHIHMFWVERSNNDMVSNYDINANSNLSPDIQHRDEVADSENPVVSEPPQECQTLDDKQGVDEMTCTGSWPL